MTKKTTMMTIAAAGVMAAAGLFADTPTVKGAMKDCLLVAGDGSIRLVRPDGSVAWEQKGCGDVRRVGLRGGAVWYANGGLYRTDIVSGKTECVVQPGDKGGVSDFVFLKDGRYVVTCRDGVTQFSADGKVDWSYRPAAGQGSTAAATVSLSSWPVGAVAVTGDEAAKQDALVKAASLAKPAKARRVLVLSRAFGYCHNDAMVFGDRAVVRGGELTGAWTADVTHDVSRLADAAFLSAYDAIVINNSTTIRAKAYPGMTEALTGFVKAGKGLCLIHSAVDSFYDDPEIADMNGGLFRGHPWGGGGLWSFRNEEPDHPVNAALKGEGSPFARSDEIYQQTGPAYSRAKDRVLVSMNMADAPTAKAAKGWKGWLRDDGDFAVSWVRRYGAGRVFYTSFGHDRRAFLDAALVGHVFAGLQYCLGDLPCDDRPRK